MFLTVRSPDDAVMFPTVMLGVPLRPVALPVTLPVTAPVRGPTKPFTAVMIPLVASSVIAVPTLTTFVKVAAVPVIMFSDPAIPVRPDPLP